MMILKQIPKVLIAPITLLVGMVYILGSVLAAISSVVTRIIGGIFILGAVFGWIAQAPESMIWNVVFTGIACLLAPLLAKGLLEIVLHLAGPLMKIMVW